MIYSSDPFENSSFGTEYTQPVAEILPPRPCTHSWDTEVNKTIRCTQEAYIQWEDNHKGSYKRKWPGL